ncbi:MAG TPA: alpha/beta fold hydrolase [Allosphingosinicella sp.]|nr:alpha/beta fold hydrolase [Allosphingosinicella sp.]
MLIAIAAAALLAMTAAPSEKLLEAAGPQGPLKGKLIAVERGPVALIIPGSGPTDLDGNSPLGVTAATYRLLGEALAEQGISSVRADKRGMFSSKAAIPNANAVTMADYVGDVRSWTDVIRKETGARCVWLIGHSEGALVALLAAQQVPNLCGSILVAAPGRPVGEVLRGQLRANPANAPILDDALRAIATLEKGERVDPSAMHPALMSLFNPDVQGFLISLMAVDPAKLAAAHSKPLLIVQGESDIQVGTSDAGRLAAANPKAKLVMLPKVTHTLKEAASESREASLATYRDSSLPVAPGVVKAIAEFIKAK